MLSRQAAFCGFLFHKLQSHSKAGMWETYLTPKTIHIQATIWPESYFCSSCKVFISDVNCCRCCGVHSWVQRMCADQRQRIHLGDGDSGAHSWNADDTRHSSTERTGFFPTVGGGTGFKLDDWCISPVSQHPEYPHLLAHLQMKINLQFTCTSHVYCSSTQPSIYACLCLIEIVLKNVGITQGPLRKRTAHSNGATKGA